jgi:hypothetical protein
MSGLEVVGIVLGAVPLVISALEHYAEGVKAIRVIRHAAQEFRAVARKLDAEHMIFRNTLAILLNDCTGIEAATVRSLMDDVRGEEWRKPNVKAALERRLGESMQSYFKHIQSISDTLEDFQDRLHLGSNGQVRILWRLTGNEN